MNTKTGYLKVKIVLSLLFITISGVQSADPMYFNGTGHWYEVVTLQSSLTWHQCRDSAISKGGYLATVGSAEENSFLLTLPLPPFHAFLGATDEITEGVWVWETGDTFWVGFAGTGYYEWAVGEPNNMSGDEHYLDLITSGVNDGKWNDGLVYSPNITSFIVEYNFDPCCVPPFRGDVNGSGNITVADLVRLVSYLFAEGPEPECLAEANVNGAGNVSVADITYLVTFLFNSGPSPASCE